jgi:hypothetical protein
MTRISLLHTNQANHHTLQSIATCGAMVVTRADVLSDHVPMRLERLRVDVVISDKPARASYSPTR